MPTSLLDIDEWIERQLAHAPEFTGEQFDRLRTLFWGVQLADPVTQ